MHNNNDSFYKIAQLTQTMRINNNISSMSIDNIINSYRKIYNDLILQYNLEKDQNNKVIIDKHICNIY